MDDITERVELEVQLTQADKLSSIGLLAAGVAHEVNTPLAVISSYTQTLAKQLQSPRTRRRPRCSRRSLKQTFRASEIVNNLLNFSGTTGAEFAEISLNKVVADTLALLDHQFKVAHVEVQAELSECLAFDSRQRRKIAAGISELVPERKRCDGRRWSSRCGDAERRIGERARQRYRLWHCSGTHSSYLRSVLHHQDFAHRRTEPRQPAWDYPSPTESSRDTRAISGSRAGRGAVPMFTLDFPLIRKATHV